MKKLVISFLLVVFATSTFIILSPQKTTAAVEGHCDGSGEFLGFPTWYKYLDIGGPNCEIKGPLAPGSTPDNMKIDWEKAAGRVGIAVVEILLRIAALVAIGYVIYGGFRYITSQGDPEGAKSARQTIINGIIGLVISLIATGLVLFIASKLS